MNANTISRVIAVLGKFLSPEEMTSVEKLISELLSSKASQFDWSYPLSEILDQYNRKLLEQECDLNYSQTALVIQNSANVFERRVDRLYQDTSGLRNSLNEHDAENEAAKAAKPRRRGHRNQLDLDNIERVDFHKDVSKNCLLKSKKPSKKVKLLSQRYPQLENMCRHKFSLDIIDTLGEKIGKKYDFRCNQQLSSSHMLVDELSPEDLEQTQEYNENTEDDSPPRSVSSPLPNSSIPDGISSPSCSRISPTPSQCLPESQYTSDLDTDDFCDADPGNESQESGYGTMTDISGNLTQDLSQNISSSLLDDRMRENPGCSSLLDVSGHLTPPEEVQERTGGDLSDLTSAAHNLSDTLTQTDDLEAPTDDLCTSEAQNTTELPEKSCDETLNSPLRKRSRESVETDVGYMSGDPQDIPSSPECVGRSKRLRKSVINELNSDGYQAIPFEAPIPEKNMRTRTEFKLPCHISLLKSTASKKRKANGELRRKRKLTRYLTEEKEKMMRKCQISRLVDDEVIEERLLKERLTCSISEFDAVLGENEDLRGFSLRFSDCLAISKDICAEEASCSRIGGEEVEKELEKEQGTEIGGEQGKDQENTNITSEIINNCLHELQETSCSYTPPHSPEFSGGFEPGGSSDEEDVEENHCEPSTSAMSHQEKIEKRMRELQKEFDVRNDRVDETKRWMKAMEALRVAEKRAEFDVEDYEGRIVRNLTEKEDKTMQFEEIAMREEPEDIARLFVASLHLANTYDVEISSSKETSSVTLSLLKDPRDKKQTQKEQNC